MTTTTSFPRLGIALGGGAARGWAHIGILSALAQRGIEPEIVCGTSIGALVGGIYAAGKLAELEEWAGSLTRRDVLALVDLTVTGGGIVGGRKLMELYRQHLGEPNIEELARRFAAVATDLETGAEVWLQKGPLLTAIRASISIPGMFTPVRHNERWLVDGALVNPVPVSLCRAMGAEVVVAVALHGGRGARSHRHASAEAQPAVVRERSGRPGLAGLLSRSEPGERGEQAATAVAPNVRSVILASLDIMQDRISRSRLAGDPPDLLLAPRVREVQPLEFAGGQATIEEGYNVVRRMMPALSDLLALERAP